jgi:hypothetical protein
MKAFKKEIKGYKLTGLTEDGTSYMLKLYRAGSQVSYKRVYVSDLKMHESIESKALEMVQLDEMEQELDSWGRG